MLHYIYLQYNHTGAAGNGVASWSRIIRRRGRRQGRLAGRSQTRTPGLNLGLLVGFYRGHLWTFRTVFEPVSPGCGGGLCWLWVRSVLDAPEARRSSDCGAPEQGSDTGEVEEVSRLCGNQHLRWLCPCVGVQLYALINGNVPVIKTRLKLLHMLANISVFVLEEGASWLLTVSLVAFHCHRPLVLAMLTG